MQSQGAVPFILMVIRPFRVCLFGMVAIAFIWALMLNVQPYIVKLILNAAMGENQTNLFRELAALMLLYLLSELIYVFVFRVYDFIIIKFRPTIKKYIGLVLMDKMMEHSHSFYQRQFAGSLTT